MCGITGWVAYRRDLSTEHEVVDAMTETMSCRGPDARGTWWAVTRSAPTRTPRSSCAPTPSGVRRSPSG